MTEDPRRVEQSLLAATGYAYQRLCATVDRGGPDADRAFDARAIAENMAAYVASVNARLSGVSRG